ncbi:lipopolysaccharide heptosyltransferase family protein [Prosthecochloris sp. ZM_2]|uniref:glycosyltransferase family 9 protein n=1 Tax=Prosthecochloris sp. ZM_2 TaxID=2045206 RepID=UPI000DF7551F|nr:glycosyltransferase family 9 protein [Prosthecochloris sp. ZM_2]RNA64289.1 lipopolysaccharide heptosyltransferase family protein [Prosthecochloris sp. ZM_2]
MTVQKDWKKQRRFRQGLAKSLQKIFHRTLRRPPCAGPLDSVVILAQEKYGDAVLLTPLLKNLKTAFPDTEIHLVTFSKAVTTFFSTDSHISGIHYVKGNPVRLLRLIAGHRFDLLFNSKDHPSTTFLLFTILIRARVKAGIDCEFHRGLYDYLVTIDYDSPIALKNCGLLALLGRPAESDDCRPYLPPGPVSDRISNFLEDNDLTGVTGINISAGRPNRYWTQEKWRQLIVAFPDRKFVILSGPGDLETKQTLEGAAPTVHPSPPTANLYEASLIIKHLSLLVTPDTSMVHVASCHRIPVVGLYGTAPQDQSRFRPFLIDYRMVVSHTRSVSEIAVDDVIRAIRDIEAESRTQSSTVS